MNHDQRRRLMDAISAQAVVVREMAVLTEIDRAVDGWVRPGEAKFVNQALTLAKHYINRIARK